MNNWIKLSIEYANQRSYLDDLFHVYPTIPDGIRETDNEIWDAVEKAFKNKNNIMRALVLRNYLYIKEKTTTAKWQVLYVN